MRGVFTPLPRVPDHPELERRGHARAGTPSRPSSGCVSRTRGRDRFSFIDGPITANNPMGVHHAGADAQGLPALQGVARLRPAVPERLRLPGLWVEVEVEKSLGLNSKRDIEEYGLAEFAACCRERVAEYAEVMTNQDRRLGRWMDWDNDYTFSDTNIEYIWRFRRRSTSVGGSTVDTDRRNGAPAAAPRCRSTNRRERRITRSPTTRRSTFGFR